MFIKSKAAPKHDAASTTYVSSLSITVKGFWCHLSKLIHFICGFWFFKCCMFYLFWICIKVFDRTSKYLIIT